MRSISQSQIRLYQKCPYAYYLENVRELCWPVEEKEHHKDVGSAFHFMVRQKLIGIPDELILAAETDESVLALFHSFLRADPIHSAQMIYPEQKAAVPMHNILWTGVFDVLTVEDSTITVYDWKTGKRRSTKAYESDPQTVLYRWLAASIGGRVLGMSESLAPESVRMVYWFPSDPQNPVILPYSAEAFAADRKKMRAWGEDLTADGESRYPKTEDVKRCVSCRFKLYCHGLSELPGLSRNAPDELPEYDHQYALWELSDEDERVEIAF